MCPASIVPPIEKETIVLFRLLLLFIGVPLLELVLLLLLAEATRWWVSVLVVVVTGIAGSLLARSQGFRTYQRIHQELAAGRMPTDALMDAVMIFVAGALLVTPGLLTDLVGFSLLIPVCRRWYRECLARWIKTRFTVQTVSPNGSPWDRSQVIDSYVVEESPDSKVGENSPESRVESPE